MEFLLKIISLFLYFSYVTPMLMYIYDENPNGYVASVNSLGIFPRNKVSGYKKYLEGNNYKNGKFNHVMDSHFKLASPSKAAPVPVKYNYVPVISYTQDSGPQKVIKEEINKEMKDNRKNITQIEISSAKEVFFTPNNFGNNRKAYETQPIKINNHNTKLDALDKEVEQMYKHQIQVARTQQKTDMLELKDKSLHKANINNNRNLEQTQVDNQKLVNAFPRQPEFIKRNAIENIKSDKRNERKYGKTNFDIEKYVSKSWNSKKSVNAERIPARIGGIDVGEEVNRRPYALFYKMNHGGYDHTDDSSDDENIVEATINGENDFVKYDQRGPRNANVRKALVKNYNAFRD